VCVNRAEFRSPERERERERGREGERERERETEREREECVMAGCATLVNNNKQSTTVQ